MKGLIPKVWVGYVPKIKALKKDTTPTTKPTSLPKLPTKGYYAKGDKSKEIGKIQTILNYLKLNCGAVDNYYGGLTASAVKQYQKKYNLKQDGKWGKQCNAMAKTILGL